LLSKNTKYWFFIHPYVHISLKRNKLLLYNTYSGKALEYENIPEINKIARRLIIKKNMLTIGIDKHQMNHTPVIATFVRRVRESYMGDLLEQKPDSPKPFQMAPVLHIDEDIKRIKGNSRIPFRFDIKKYLTEISFFINEACGQNCAFCHDASKQFLCCTGNKNRKRDIELPLEHIVSTIAQIRGGSLARINILGGDVLQYSRFNSLISILSSLPVSKTFYIHYKNFKNRENEILSMQRAQYTIRVIVDFPFLESEGPELFLTLRHFKNLQYMFIVQNGDDIRASNEMKARFEIKDSLFRPYYNKRNMLFFRKHVFIKKKGLLESRVGMRDIQRNRVLNPLNFGKLIVTNDGSIFSNLNVSKLGSIGKHFIEDILYKELLQGKSWRRTRLNLTPCRQCNFRLMCPPPGNFEYALGMNNPCNIWNSCLDEKSLNRA
jgi:pseudo-rSAM protein